jgi:1A family penicillin-binding protein
MEIRQPLKERLMTDQPLPLGVPAAPQASPAQSQARSRDRGRWLIAAGAGLVLALIVGFMVTLPLGRALEPLQSPTLVLVSADGHAFARRGAFQQEPVDVHRLPPHVAQAFVAIEDRRFYQHSGIDPGGIVRALWQNVRAGGVRQGGSTITQQLAKNAFLTPRRSLQRKAQEAVIALWLEARLSKDEILSRYLSAVYFGDGVFGLRAASRHYFGKSPEQLTLGESAMLAGMVASPTRLAPTHHWHAALRRQAQVLAAMSEMHFVTADQIAAARQVRLNPTPPARPVGSYFADWISTSSRDRFNRAFGEVRVQTTLDSRLQRRAEQVLARTLAGPGAAMGATQGALVAMRTDGRVVAMVGGRDYRTSQYNRAVDAERQPGSAFKLFVYLAALRAGYTADSPVLDAPLSVGNWTPDNYEGQYTGRPITLREAFARSSNVAAVRLSEQIGRQNVIRAARDLGITTPLPDSPSVALGAGSVSLMQLTAAYASIAADLAPVTPRGLADDPQAPARRLTAQERAGMLDLMRAVVTSGTGQAANLPIGSYGKTGTSQDYHDAWFVGFAGDLVIGVWIGNDDNTPMRRVTGGSLPAQVWRQVMEYAVANIGVRTQATSVAAPVPRTSLIPFWPRSQPAEEESAPMIAPPPPPAARRPDTGDAAAPVIEEMPPGPFEDAPPLRNSVPAPMIDPSRAENEADPAPPERRFEAPPRVRPPPPAFEDDGPPREDARELAAQPAFE